ncbi:type IV pilus twitching motility protein PilT [Candidatus Omnitrophota bacterium]
MTAKVNIDSLLRALVDNNGSDLHLQANNSPLFRIYGDLVSSGMDLLRPEDIEEFVFSIMNEPQRNNFLRTKHLDFSYALAGVGRFRANAFRQRGYVGAVLRAIPEEISSMEELGLPPVVKQLASRPNGLILITGPTGSGKTTSLAAIVDYINNTRRGHIITIEDPIEFVHSNKKCVINQRELHLDTESFSVALRDALREDPDVILVGEMRDLETIALAITAAETGHLVFATLHTNNAPQTVDRMIDVFPPHQQRQIRTQLAGTLRAVIAQTLLRKKDGLGRVAAFEVMVGNSAISSIINDGKSNQIYSAMQIGRNDGMQTMDAALKALVVKGVVAREEAFLKLVDRTMLNLTSKKA